MIQTTIAYEQILTTFYRVINNVVNMLKELG